MAALVVGKGGRPSLHRAMGSLLGALALMSGCDAANSGNTFGPPGISISALSMSFAQAVGGAAGTAQTMTVDNTGGGSLNVTLAITGQNPTSFAETDNCSTPVGPVGHCTISVTFSPNGVVSARANLVISSNVGSPLTVALSGTGTVPTISVGTSTLSFSTAVAATSAAQTVTVNNTGTVPATLGGITLGGANAASFAQTNTCGTTLAAASSCAIAVTFAPTALGLYAGTISIADNATGSPQTVTLSGATPDLGTLTAVSDSTTFSLTNVASGMVLGVSGQSQVAGTAMAQETAGGTDAQWHTMPMNNNEYNVENMLTHQVMGVSAGSTGAGAQVVQWADNSTADHLWEFYVLPDGNYLVQNVNSGLYLEDAGSNLTSAAVIDQNTRPAAGAGCTCQEWTLKSSGSSPYPNPATVNVSYTNGDTGFIHDPSMVKAGSIYYLFGTHGTLHAHTSTDRVNFTDTGYGLSALPAWTNTYDGSDGDLWAPDASMHNGQYWLYYAASTFGSSNSAVGLAVSPTGAPGTYVDTGAVVYPSASCAGSNAIDPASVVDFTGNAWMLFGSWSNGLHIVPVNNATGLPTGAACTLLAYRANGLEGSYIYKHGTYYYLFGSINMCCAGVTSTYRIIVGRATAITGPYTDRGGLAMTAGGGTILLSAHGTINGPGGQTVLSDTDGDVLVYHYYDGNNNGVPSLGINHLAWTTDGWPYVVP